MTLLALRLQGPIFRGEWSASTSGAAASGGLNQFLYPAADTSSPAVATLEIQSQRPAGVAIRVWRFGGGFTRGTPTSQATITARVNGVSQGSTATVIGTALGITLTDLATSIAVKNTDLISTLFVTTTTDTDTTHPTAIMLGVVNSSF